MSIEKQPALHFPKCRLLFKPQQTDCSITTDTARPRQRRHGLVS